MRAEPQRIGEVKAIAQQAFAGSQRQPRQVHAAEGDQVEHVVVDRHPGPPGRPRIGQVDALLQPRETRLVAFEGDHLAVQHEPVGALGGERVDDLRVGRVDPLVVA